jgi:hypothetical protein
MPLPVLLLRLSHRLRRFFAGEFAAVVIVDDDVDVVSRALRTSVKSMMPSSSSSYPITAFVTAAEAFAFVDFDAFFDVVAKSASSRRRAASATLAANTRSMSVSRLFCFCSARR